MAGNDSERPIIIKKVKKAAHAHHGGAWKVAYADFVTAMMAFFLMLWLLSAVDEAKLEGLAEYFTPTVGLRDSMGIGFEGGETVEKDGVKKEDAAPPNISPSLPSAMTDSDVDKDSPIEAEKDAQLFEKAEEDIKKAFETDPNLRDLSDNIIVEQTPEGLKIEITDSDKYPMFDPGSTILTNYGRNIISKMGLVIEQLPNFISITGHTDSAPMTSRGRDYSNWELSTERANAARRYLLQTGLSSQRPKKVVGHASTDLLLKEEPLSSRNRRITIILLRGDYMDLDPSDRPVMRDLLNVPSSGSRQSTPSPIAPTRQPDPVPAAPAPATAAPADPGLTAAPDRTQPAAPAPVTPPQPLRPTTPQDYAPFTDQ